MRKKCGNFQKIPELLENFNQDIEFFNRVLNSDAGQEARGAVEHEVTDGGADGGQTDEGVEEGDQLRQLGHLGFKE